LSSSSGRDGILPRTLTLILYQKLALLSREKRTATVVALEDCRLLQLDQNSVWTVVNMFPTMFKTMKDVASKRIDQQVFLTLQSFLCSMTLVFPDARFSLVTS
jgi:CRP-like cAMP-binding protein